MHVSAVLRVMGEADLEPLDVENLRPHYGRTLWAWSDALEAQLERAARTTRDSVVRAYRLYLAGSAMSFEHGWLSLSQVLASRPTGSPADGPMRGAQSQFPFNRGYMYAKS
jgi:cyclopropane-fatty-acyl-phospholipid synthase